MNSTACSASDLSGDSMALIALTTTVALSLVLGLGAAHLMLWAVVLFLKGEFKPNTPITVRIPKEAEYETQTTDWHTAQMDPLSARTRGYVPA
jgi:hypothetical protein